MMNPHVLFTASVLLASCLSVAGPIQAQQAPTAVAEVKGIARAENLLQAPPNASSTPGSSGRIFATGSDGLFELKHTASGPWEAVRLPSAPTCYYHGMAVLQDTLYAACSDEPTKNTGRNRLLAVDLNDPNALVRQVADLDAKGFVNGMASDGQNHLYYAVSGVLASGAIHRLTLNGPGQVATQTKLADLPWQNPNGLRWHQGRLYASVNSWTIFVGMSYLVSWRVDEASESAKLQDKQVYHCTPWVLDDFELIEGGFLVTAYLADRVRQLSMDGSVLKEWKVSTPTSVRLVSENGAPAWVAVTQLGAGRVTLTNNDAGWQPVQP